MSISSKQFKELSFEEQLAAIERGDISDAIVIKMPLDAALSNHPLNIAGNYISAIASSDTLANIDVEFNRTGTGKVNFSQGLAISRPFRQVFLSCTAQTGKYVTFIISQLSPVFSITDNRSQALQTNYLATIATYAPDLDALLGKIGTQVTKSGDQSGAGTVTIHTVTTGKTFVLTALHVDSKIDATLSAPAGVAFRIRNGATVVARLLVHTYTAGIGTGYSKVSTLSFGNNPIRIPAGYKLDIDSESGVSAACDIVGYEV